MDVVQTYTLKHPLKITIRDSKGERHEEIAEVRFRKPLAGDLVALDKAEGQTAAMFHFVSYISDISYSQIEKLEIEDGRGLIEVANGFLRPGRTTSGTSSDNS